MSGRKVDKLCEHAASKLNCMEPCCTTKERSERDAGNKTCHCHENEPWVISSHLSLYAKHNLIPAPPTQYSHQLLHISHSYSFFFQWPARERLIRTRVSYIYILCKGGRIRKFFACQIIIESLLEANRLWARLTIKAVGSAAGSEIERRLINQSESRLLPIPTVNMSP